MVKLTMVVRVSDGLLLAYGLRYVNQDNGYPSFYQKQAQIILQEISRGALTASKMTIRIDHHFFKETVMKGEIFQISFIYLFLFTPLLAAATFAYFLGQNITIPMADAMIANIRRQYIATRTQANLSKLNANRRQDIDFVAEDMSNILGRTPETVGRFPATPPSAFPIWGSPRLEVSYKLLRMTNEVIALKWAPIMIIVVASMVLLWASLVFTDYAII